MLPMRRKGDGSGDMHEKRGFEVEQRYLEASLSKHSEHDAVERVV